MRGASLLLERMVVSGSYPAFVVRGCPQRWVGCGQSDRLPLHGFQRTPSQLKRTPTCMLDSSQHSKGELCEPHSPCSFSMEPHPFL